jgi:hypothetical protein
MPPIRIIGTVDAAHRLTATVPVAVPAGEVEVVLIIPEPHIDAGERLWEAGIAAEWHDDLADERQDIYTLDDGIPVDEAR